MFYELLVILAQLRHMPSAMRSEKPTVKHEHDILFPLVIGKVDSSTLAVCCREIRRQLRLIIFYHILQFLSNLQVECASSAICANNGVPEERL